MRFFRFTASYVFEMPDDTTPDALADALPDLLIAFAESRDGFVGGSASVEEIDADGEPTPWRDAAS